MCPLGCLRDMWPSRSLARVRLLPALLGSADAGAGKFLETGGANVRRRKQKGPEAFKHCARDAIGAQGFGNWNTQRRRITQQ